MDETLKHTQGAVGQQPDLQLRLEEFFDGTLHAEGEFRDPLGRLRRTFCAQVTGTRSGDTIRVRETFRYNDGDVDEREWLIEALGNGKYRGSASDVIGYALGQVEGRRMRWTYPLDLPLGGRAWRLRFEDEFELSHAGELINTAKVKKFGLPVGTVRQIIARRGNALSSETARA